jgi:hypothetical protein
MEGGKEGRRGSWVMQMGNSANEKLELWLFISVVERAADLSFRFGRKKLCFNPFPSFFSLSGIVFFTLT